MVRSLWGCLFCFWLAVASWSDAFANPQLISPEEYKGIRDVTLEILKRCPPSECLYVGIGRSPTPIISFLQNVPHAIAVTVPFSKASNTIIEHIWRITPEF